MKIIITFFAIASLLFSAIHESDKAEGFDLIYVTHKEKRLSMADLKGKTIVLNFWASWCPGCKAEMPDFIDMKSRLPKDVELVAINIDNDRYKARDFLDSVEERVGKSFNFPILYDEGKEIANTYRPKALPSTYIINKSGKVVKLFMRSFNKHTIHILEEAIKKAQ